MKKILKLFLIVFLTLGLASCNQKTETYNFQCEVEGSGSVYGTTNGKYLKDTKITITATPNDNFDFVGWYEVETKVSENSTYEFNITKDTHLIAKFVSNLPPLEEYNFSVVVEGEGKVEGTENGTYTENSLISLNAYPETGYRFGGFYEGTNLLNKNSNYSFEITKDIIVIAKFVENSNLDEDTISLRWQHNFLQDDFNASVTSNVPAGTSKVINGLSWEYSLIRFLGQSSEGVQIGSNKNPHNVDPFVMSFVFPGDVELVSYSLNFKGSGNPVAQVNFSDFSVEHAATSTLSEYTSTDIMVVGDTLSFSFLVGSKAFYLYSLEFEINAPTSYGLDLTDDFGNHDSIKPVVPGQGDIPETNYTLISKEDYYRDVNLQLEGNDLRVALNQKISQMTKISYKRATAIMCYTDESIDKKGYVYGMYDGDYMVASPTGIWNKEHVWSWSLIKETETQQRPDDNANQGSDIHNLRITCQIVNGLHGNKYYDNSTTEQFFFPNITDMNPTAHENQGDHRGDVARILFYMYTRYTYLNLVDEWTDALMTIGKLSTLKEWNELDPVDEFEIQRNNRIYEYQGNRNPFIDYPELVNQII